MIVRELIAVLGLEMDDQAFQKADQKFSALTKAATALGTVLVSGVVARGLSHFVDMASDANETQNLLRQTFEDRSMRVRFLGR